MDAPIRVSLRAWAPFIPGDAKTSNTPGRRFLKFTENNEILAEAGTLAFSFPVRRASHEGRRDRWTKSL